MPYASMPDCLLRQLPISGAESRTSMKFEHTSSQSRCRSLHSYLARPHSYAVPCLTYLTPPRLSWQ